MDKFGENKQEKGISFADDSYSDGTRKAYLDYPTAGSTMALAKQKGLMKPPIPPRRVVQNSVVDSLASNYVQVNDDRKQSSRKILMDLVEVQDKLKRLTTKIGGDTSSEALLQSIKQRISKCLSIVSTLEHYSAGSPTPLDLISGHGTSHVSTLEQISELGPSQVSTSEHSDHAGSAVPLDQILECGQSQVSTLEHSDHAVSAMALDVISELGSSQVSTSEHSDHAVSAMALDVISELGQSQVSYPLHSQAGSSMPINLNLEVKSSQVSFLAEGGIVSSAEKMHFEVDEKGAWVMISSDRVSSGLEASRYYAALFPPDYEFEKDTLIQLWISKGFFIEEPMEKAAALYFEEIVTMGHFGFSRINSVSGKAMYKVLTPISPLNHDIVFMDRISNLKDVSPQVSHLSMRCDMDFTVLSQLKKLKQLRTVILLQGCQVRTSQVPRDFFLSMPLLQTLDLSRTCLIELPSSIGYLKSLRYLDLSETPIKCLPETIDRLEYLQTLKLRGCSKFSTLPEGLRKLVNLCHLDLDVLRQLRTMPHGMGCLTNLRTLSAFIVDEAEECSIRQLKNLNNLSGSFCVSRLENVLTDEEAIEACLFSKPALTKLELRWSDSQDEDDAGHSTVLCCLRPSSSLKELRIRCYGGLELPSWISDAAFYQLHSITLVKCENCLLLPSLGQLPALKFLTITDFYNLKVINNNLCGGFGIQDFTAFPVLEKLTIENMDSLEEVEGIRDGDFPCLGKLSIKHCPLLHSLCSLSCLRALHDLEITHCEVLGSFPLAELPSSLKEFAIENCPSISRHLKNGDRILPVGTHAWVDHQEI